jgi:hypothetical protein
LSHNRILLLAASVLSHAPSESESRLRQGLRLEQKKETSGAPQRPLFSRGLNYDSDFDEGEGREKVKCDRARRFGRGLASVLCSWEVVKQKFTLAQINPSSQVDLPSEAETKKSSRKARASSTVWTIHAHPPSLSIRPLFAQHFTSDSMGREASLRVASTSASATEATGS